MSRSCWDDIERGVRWASGSPPWHEIHEKGDVVGIAPVASSSLISCCVGLASVPSGLGRTALLAATLRWSAWWAGSA